METQGGSSSQGVEIPDAPTLTQELLRDMAGLRAQLSRVTRDTDLAEDILHDAIVTALQKAQAGEISTRSQLDGYVYRVALNHYRNHKRKEHSRSAESDVEDLVDLNERDIPETLESAQWLRLAKQLLNDVTPARDRELLVRFYLYEESKELLCQSFGLSDLHFNRVIFRAKERFRELLKRKGLRKSDFLSIVFVFFAA